MSVGTGNFDRCDLATGASVTSVPCDTDRYSAIRCLHPDLSSLRGRSPESHIPDSPKPLLTRSGDFNPADAWAGRNPRQTMYSDLDAASVEEGAMIVHDKENSRIVDQDTGEYVEWSLFDRETNEWYFIIYAKDGTPVFGSIVERLAWGGTPTQGATDVKYTVKKAWFPSGQAERPEYYDGPTEFISKLHEFLKSHKYYYGVKTPDPDFHFSDGRKAAESLS